MVFGGCAYTHKIKLVDKVVCPECGDDLMYETDYGISCVCGFETLDETEVKLFA